MENIDNNSQTKLHGKTILITGASRRIGRVLALAIAKSGGNVIIHHGSTPTEAEDVKDEITNFGGTAYVLQADLNDPKQTKELINHAYQISPLFGLVNNAAIFEPYGFFETNLDVWERHLMINLTSPYLLCQAFAKTLGIKKKGRIVNILDWRAFRPKADHFAYTISKSGLAALTQSLAVALSPNIIVNGLTFGAILPPSDGARTDDILEDVPVGRWAKLSEVSEVLIFLLTGPSYITGDFIYLDGGRHLI